jgi:hypothetical protein
MARMLTQATTSPSRRSLKAQKQSPAGANRRGFILPGMEVQQRPPWIAFSVQFAAEFTSAAAPRTVLHAASAMQVPTSNAVTSFDFMSTLRFVP